MGGFALSFRITLISTDITPSDQQLSCLDEWAQSQTVVIGGTELPVSIVVGY